MSQSSPTGAFVAAPPARGLANLVGIPTAGLVAALVLPLAASVGFAAGAVPLIGVLALDIVLALVVGVDWALASGQVEARREVTAVHAVGRRFVVSLSVRNAGRRPLHLRVTDDPPGPSTGLPLVLAVAPGQARTASYHAHVEDRGRHPFGPVTVRWRSPLGFWECQRRIAVDGEVRVYPNFAQLRTWDPPLRDSDQHAPVRAQRRPGGENEFERLRPYVAGDPYRHVDWKATARRQQLVSREFGQESNQNVLFLLDCGRMMSARSGEMRSFDQALNAAVMLGQAALARGDRVGMLAFDRQLRAWLPPRAGRRSGSRLIRATYDLFPSLDEPDYALAFRHLDRQVRRRSLVVLFTSIIDQVNADLARHVSRALARRHLPVVVWLRDPELDAVVASPDTDPFARGATAEVLGWRKASLDAMRREGSLVVDCAVGNLNRELHATYQEIKARRLL